MLSSPALGPPAHANADFSRVARAPATRPGVFPGVARTENRAILALDPHLMSAKHGGMTISRNMTRVGSLMADPATKDATTNIDLAGRNPGVHQEERVFFELSAEGKVSWVVSRVCDHANGRLSLVTGAKDGSCRARCPLHGWELDLNTRCYTNVGVEKPVLPFVVKDGQLIVSGAETPSLVHSAGMRLPKAQSVTVRFLAHAALQVDINGFTIVTDPWLIGPCFTTGWWHAVAPKSDVLEVLRQADLIYISHNHPDHLHRETLQYVLAIRPEIPIIVPPFPSGSTARPLHEMGFTNVIELEFNSLFRPAWSADAPAFSILNSGDFRDDSGLYIAAEGFTGLLTVDAAALNSMSLPTDVDFLATAFAAGATGFPWCFEHIPMEQRQRIQQRNRGAVQKLADDYISATRPRVYMPYAGYFTERATRDAFIRENNIKNSPDTIRERQSARIRAGMIFVDPRQTDVIHFDGPGSVPRLSSAPGEPLFPLTVETTLPYLEREAREAEGFDVHELARYLEASAYHDDLLVTLVPCDESFVPRGDALILDPSGHRPTTRVVPPLEARAEYDTDDPAGRRKIWIRVRQAPLADVVRHRLPWEDLSIGFQSRIERRPDVYESHFWFHFTNVYIGQAVP